MVVGLSAGAMGLAAWAWLDGGGVAPVAALLILGVPVLLAIGSTISGLLETGSASLAAGGIALLLAFGCVAGFLGGSRLVPWGWSEPVALRLDAPGGREWLPSGAVRVLVFSPALAAGAPASDRTGRYVLDVAESRLEGSLSHTTRYVRAQTRIVPPAVWGDVAGPQTPGPTTLMQGFDRSVSALDEIWLSRSAEQSITLRVLDVALRPDLVVRFQPIRMPGWLDNVLLLPMLLVGLAADRRKGAHPRRIVPNLVMLGAVFNFLRVTEGLGPVGSSLCSVCAGLAVGVIADFAVSRRAKTPS